jgi:Ca2+-binding RTX toxin-like protein
MEPQMPAAPRSQLPDWVTSFDATTYDPLAKIGGQSALNAKLADAAASSLEIAVGTGNTVALSQTSDWYKLVVPAAPGIYGTTYVAGSGAGDHVYLTAGADYRITRVDLGDGNDIFLQYERSGDPPYVPPRMPIEGGAGDDLLMGWKVTGGTGNDVLIGTTGAGYGGLLSGGDGDDVIVGMTHRLEGGDGNDILVASQHAWVDGGFGDDLLISGDMGSNFRVSRGTDTVLGGDGADMVVLGNPGYDPSLLTYFSGGAGRDSIQAYSGGLLTADMANGFVNTPDAGRLVFEGVESIFVHAPRALITGTSESDEVSVSAVHRARVMTGEGDDTVTVFTSSPGQKYVTVDVGAGDDTLYSYDPLQGTSSFVARYTGGAGNDTIMIKGTIDLSTGRASSDSSLKAVLQGFENVTGRESNDSITGDRGANTLQGAEGNDTLRGGDGKDSLKGGKGHDIFVYEIEDLFDDSGKPGAPDRILDFGYSFVENGVTVVQQDKIDLRALLKGQSYESIDDVVQLKDASGGTTLSVQVNSKFVDVAFLKNWHGDTASEHFADGYLLS